MDIISQLQEQVNSIAAITFNAFGTLQRDAPPVQLSPNYPEPPAPAAAAVAAATTTATDGDATAAFPEQPKQLSADLVKAAKQVCFFLSSIFYPYPSLLLSLYGVHQRNSKVKMAFAIWQR